MHWILKMAQSDYMRGLTPIVVMNSNLCQHGIVLNLGLPQWWTVVGDDDQFPCKQSKNVYNKPKPHPQ